MRATFLSDLESGQLVNKEKKMLTVDVYDVNTCFRAKDNVNNILVTSKTFLGPIEIVYSKFLNYYFLFGLEINSIIFLILLYQIQFCTSFKWHSEMFC